MGYGGEREEREKKREKERGKREEREGSTEYTASQRQSTYYECKCETGLHENRFSFCHEESRNECLADTYDKLLHRVRFGKMPHGRNGFGQLEAVAWPESRHNFVSESEWVKVS